MLSGNLKTLSQQSVELETVRLTSTYSDEVGGRHLLQVWVDPDRGYFPVRIETWKLSQDSTPDVPPLIKMKVEILDLQEYSPGIWIPLRGLLDLFYTDRVLPEGVDEAQLRRMSREEWERLRPRIAYQSRSLGEGHGWPLLIVIDPTTLRVNEPIPSDAFKLDFPPDVRVLNEFTNLAPLRRNPPVMSSDAANSVRRNWSLLLWVNLAFLIVFMALLAYRRLVR